MGLFSKLKSAFLGNKENDTEQAANETGFDRAGGYTQSAIYQYGDRSPATKEYVYLGRRDPQAKFQQNSGYENETVGSRPILGQDASGKAYGSGWGFKTVRSPQIAMRCPNCQNGWGGVGGGSYTPDGNNGYPMNGADALGHATSGAGVHGDWGIRQESMGGIPYKYSNKKM